jgi:glycosyltransferase involved in cell wall biosynthesis
MRILFLTQWFDPEPAFKGLVFAKTLQNSGQEVEVITGFPNYPGGKLYPNYRIKWLQRERLGGIRVNRVPLYPSHNSSAMARVVNYVSFALSSCLYGILAAPKADVIYVYHPPITVGFSAAFISILRRIPFVIDINDLWPDTLESTGMVRNKHVLAIVGQVCLWIYKRASHIVVGTPGIRNRLIERGVPQDKIEVIYNWCDEQALRLPATVNTSDFGMNGRFNIVFAGTMGKAQALDAVIRAAKRVESNNANIQFVFVGGGIEVENLKSLAQTLQVSNVLFLPRMPMNEVGKVLTAADVLLVHLKDDPLFEITLPSKTQAYMGVGKPVLMAVKGDAAHLIEISGAGRCAQPENEDSLARVAIEMANLPASTLIEMGGRGAEYYAENLSLSIGTGKFLSLFKMIAANQAK